MKKLLVLSLLFAPMCAFGLDTSINGVEEPQWRSFVPPAYVDVKEPRGLGRFNDTSAYWYKRRVEFDTGIEKCRAIESTDEKVACYQQLKVKQYQKNSDYNARLEAIEQANKGPQEMYDRTNNMLPLGNPLENFTKFHPNEFR